MKTSWNTNKSETSKKLSKRSVHLVNISNDLTNDKRLPIHLMITFKQLQIKLLITMER